MERQAGEVDVGALAHDLMHRRRVRRDLDHRLRFAKPVQIFLAGVALADAKRFGEAPAAAARRGDDLEMLRACVLEHDRLGRLGDRGGEIGHRDRPGVDLGLADRDQMLGEIPQPEFVEVGGAVAGLGGLEHFAILAERFRPLNPPKQRFAPRAPPLLACPQQPSNERHLPMAKLRHIALIVPDPDKAAKFFEDAFDMKIAGRARRGVYVSDGIINVALLKQEGNEKVGIYHFGMWVDDLDQAEKKVQDAGATYLEGRPTSPDSFYECKYKDPLGIIFDLTHKGWKGAVKEVVAKP